MQNDKIKNLIENSGIITHYKTINFLREKDWKVNISSYYYDNIANITKEIDLIAEKMFLYSSKYDDSRVQIIVQLFLECKYINQEIIFWFDNINKDKAVSKLESETGLDIMYGKKMSGDIEPKQFHYLNNSKVVKLFSVNANKEDVMYKAMGQCLNAQIYYDNWIRRPLMHSFNDNIKKIVKYPIIVCDKFNKLVEVELQKNGQYSTKQIENEFLIETNYTYLDRTSKLIKNSYFLIDVIDFNYLEIFLDKLETEIKSLLDPYANKDR